MATTTTHPPAARLLTLGIELELELKPKPDVDIIHPEIFQTHEDPVGRVAAIIGKTLEQSKFNVSCIAANSPASQRAMGNGTIHEHWKVVSEAIGPVQQENCA